MGLTARQRAYKQEGRMYAKELLLAGHNVRLHHKSRKALMDVTAQNGSVVTVMNYFGRWYLLGGSGGVGYFALRKIADGNKLSVIIKKLREWLEENNAQ